MWPGCRYVKFNIVQYSSNTGQKHKDGLMYGIELKIYEWHPSAQITEPDIPDISQSLLYLPGGTPELDICQSWT